MGLLDTIGPTPRNKFFGLLADAVQSASDFAAKPFGYDNPPGQIVAGLLGGPAIAKTLDRLSYGQDLTNFGKANVPLLKPETADAAMSFAPLAAMAGKAAVKYGPAVADQMMANAMAPRTLHPQAGMVRIPGRGQIPETRADVNRLSDRLGGLLDDAGVQYTHDKSGLSPARYFEFDNPSSPGDRFKVRISDHQNIHGADFSVDPNTGQTFEEMLSSLRGIGVPVADKVKPMPKVGVMPDSVIEQVHGLPIDQIPAASIKSYRENYFFNKKGYWQRKPD